jgi:hypothetical protein
VNNPAIMDTPVPRSDFEAAVVTHTGRFHVDARPEQSIHLFTGPGEILWANGWRPVVLSGDGTERGTVFMTSHNEEVTIWVVVDFDPQTFHVRYSRVTPSIRAGTVEVFVRSDRQGDSIVDVTYQLTALSEAGNTDLAHFDAQAYSEMMAEWENEIRDAKIDYQAEFPQQSRLDLPTSPNMTKKSANS